MYKYFCSIRAPKVTPLLALMVHLVHLVHQEEAMMGHLDHQGHLDPQDRGPIGAHRVSYIQKDTQQLKIVPSCFELM